MKRTLTVAVAVALLAACTPTQLGVAHTHHDTPAVDHWPTIPVHVIHVMGWGTDNPNPAPGVFRWATLDARVDAVTRAGAEPVIALCCAPDWMKGGRPGVTDWTQLEVAPLPRHHGDFAALAATVATRYPQVKRFIVWNELKGMWDPLRNRWDIARYTDLYNRVRRAVKAVRPDAELGGPYVPVAIGARATMSHPSTLSGPWGTVDQRSLDAITYWLAEHDGADFIAVDATTTGLPGDPLVNVAAFGAITDWVQARTDLPVWWAEVHAADPGWPLDDQAAVTLAAIDHLRTAGAAVAVLWAPQAEPSGCTGCLWWADGTLTPLGATITTQGD